MAGLLQGAFERSSNAERGRCRKANSAERREGRAHRAAHHRLQRFEAAGQVRDARCPSQGEEDDTGGSPLGHHGQLQGCDAGNANRAVNVAVAGAPQHFYAGTLGGLACVSGVLA